MKKIFYGIMAATISLTMLVGPMTATSVSATPALTEYPVTSGSTPLSFVVGPDGATWFTEINSNKIGRISTSGTITEYSVPTSDARPRSITVGPDGALWFTEYDGNKIGRITTSGTITEFTLPYANVYTYLPDGIVTGPDGALWFTEFGTGQIGRITTSGTITEYSAPTGGSPTNITVGPDGALWFGEYTNADDTGGNVIGRITTSGSTQSYAIPTADAYPIDITVGPDGNLWFTELLGNKIGRITTSGVITEYSIPTSSSQPYGITTGPDGALWFTNQDGSNIDQINTSGDITEYSLLTNGYGGTGIVLGSDNSLWFGEEIDKIGKLTLPSVPTPTYFTANSSGFSRSTSPYSSGVTTQTINSDGSITVSVNSAPGYADSGFVLYEGTLGNLPNFTVNGTGDNFGLNLWFDTNNDGDYFAWDGSNNLTSLDGDTYGLSPGSTDNAMSVDGSTQFFMMDDGQNYSLNDLISGDDSTSGINANTKVAVWIGVDTPNGGSSSATINTVSGL